MQGRGYQVLHLNYSKTFAISGRAWSVKEGNKKPNHLPSAIFGLQKKSGVSQSNLPAKVFQILISAGLLTQASSYWLRLPVSQ